MSNTSIQWARSLELLPENVGVGPGIEISPWDYVVIGGEVAPGVVQVTVNADMGLDVQKAKGNKRATIQDNGDPPAKVKIVFFLQGGDIEEFRDFIIPLLRPRNATGGRPPLEIEHPECELWGISRIIIGDIRSEPPKPGGQKIITVDALEWEDRPKQVVRKSLIKGSDDFVVRNTFGQNIFDPQAPTGADAIPSTEDLLASLIP